jgi:hypothetical protein
MLGFYPKNLREMDGDIPLESPMKQLLTHTRIYFAENSCQKFTPTFKKQRKSKKTPKPNKNHTKKKQNQ